jgi:hypothetical protein
MKAFFLATLLLLFKKMALLSSLLTFKRIFVSFFQHCTVYFLAHFCPVAFFRQIIALKITLKKTHF